MGPHPSPSAPPPHRAALRSGTAAFSSLAAVAGVRRDTDSADGAIHRGSEDHDSNV